MEKLLKLSFAELEALHQYFSHQLKDPDRIKRPGSDKIFERYIGMVSEAIEKKFEDLITVVTPGKVKASRPMGRKPMEF